jgi:predicted ATPase
VPAHVDDATTQQGLTLLRAYLVQEEQDEPYEDQVEATRRKQRERAKEETLIEWGTRRPDVSVQPLRDARSRIQM